MLYFVPYLINSLFRLIVTIGDWYKSGDLAGKRREILEFLRSQAAAQRIQGEVHANSGPFNLPAILEVCTRNIWNMLTFISGA